MKVLAVHNFYKHAGGEDEVFRAETRLLRSAGHYVVEYTRTNGEIDADVLPLQLAATTVWSHGSYRAIAEVIARERPDVAHFHNTLPLISPSAYYACSDAGVPVVQTLHNYRLLCPAATLFRNGRVCEECVTHGMLRSIRRGCYRSSRAATAAVVTMLAMHRGLGTWRDKVDVYIVPSEFARRKFLASGITATVVVKPNFVDPDPGAREGPGDRALFVGRLSSEKGAATLLNAWKRLQRRIPLDIVGDGPARSDLQATSDTMPGVRWLGALPRSGALAALKHARVLVFPSECYESFGLGIVEAFACGIPVIASRLGAMKEIVRHNRTGLLFTPGDAADLAAKVDWAWSHPEEMLAMGEAARREFEDRYTAADNHKRLLAIYRGAIAMKAGPLPATVATAI